MEADHDSCADSDISNDDYDDDANDTDDGDD
jgi:hypothetical protein